MNDQETIDYWIGVTAAHETTIAKLMQEKADAIEMANRLQNLCTTDHESKVAFIARVREVLLENDQCPPSQP